MIEVYIKSKLITKWIYSLESELADFYNFNFHTSLESLKNVLDVKLKSTIVIIDLTDTNYSLYTRNYFGNNNDIKFIGVGMKMDLENIKSLIESNIFSFLEVGTSSIELNKAIKLLKKDQVYFCDLTKDHILSELVQQIKNNNNPYQIRKPFNINKLNDRLDTTKLMGLEVEALTDKEKRVSELLAQGLSYKDIALILGVTTFAINQNAKSIYRKLKVRSRSELSFRVFN